MTIVKKSMILVFLMMMAQMSLLAISFDQLKSCMLKAKNPFHYSLDVQVLQGAAQEESVMICCHGMGGDNQIGQILHSYGRVKDHLVSFNFPDYNLFNNTYDPQFTTFGTVNELLPALFVIKQAVIECNLDKINLYGFSAGGGAVINLIGILNENRFDAQLKSIGINQEIKQQILQAIQKGAVILECPLKSIEEIIAFRGFTPELGIMAERYRINHLRPIDSLVKLKGLQLNVYLYFATPDEVIGNSDDRRFIGNLKQANYKGKTTAILGPESGHINDHKTLWKKYNQTSLN